MTQHDMAFKWWYSKPADERFKIRKAYKQPFGETYNDKILKFYTDYLKAQILPADVYTEEEVIALMKKLLSHVVDGDVNSLNKKAEYFMQLNRKM